jgi:hypothetical protein
VGDWVFRLHILRRNRPDGQFPAPVCTRIGQIVAEPASAFSVAEPARPGPDGRMDGQTDVFVFFCFLWIFFVGFFSPSLKLTKMKKQNKK